jgi:hypothetical protein
MVRLPKEVRRTRTNLTQGSALPKHMSKSFHDNHGSKNHLGSIGTIVSNKLSTTANFASQKEAKPN